MFHHIRGTLVQAMPSHLVVEAGGIGYRILVPLSVSQRAPKPGTEVTVLTHLVVREDAHLLYGFFTEEERALFRTLINLKGIGAATAIQILSASNPKDFALAIERQDAGYLKRIRGIGEKSAKRIILELKGAKTLLPAGDAPAAVGIAADAAAALETMGLPPREALARVEKVLAAEPDLTLEDLVKKALQ